MEDLNGSQKTAALSLTTQDRSDGDCEPIERFADEGREDSKASYPKTDRVSEKASYASVLKSKDSTHPGATGDVDSTPNENPSGGIPNLTFLAQISSSSLSSEPGRSGTETLQQPPPRHDFVNRHYAETDLFSTGQPRHIIQFGDRRSSSAGANFSSQPVSPTTDLKQQHLRHAAPPGARPISDNSEDLHSKISHSTAFGSDNRGQLDITGPVKVHLYKRNQFPTPLTDPVYAALHAHALRKLTEAQHWRLDEKRKAEDLSPSHFTTQYEKIRALEQQQSTQVPRLLQPRFQYSASNRQSSPSTSSALNFGESPDLPSILRKRSVSSDDMATGFQRMSGDARRFPSSGYTRTENRPPMSNVLCRNGPQCRKFQEGTCSYNHDFSSISANGLSVPKKSLNVESPSFTPAFTPKSGNAQPAKIGISPKAATAAAFTPRGSGTVTPATNSHSKEPSGEFIPAQILQPTQQFSEFVPGQNFIPQQQMDPQTMQAPLNAFSPDPFMAQPGIANLDGTQAQLNPYATAASGVSNQQFFQDANTYKHPLNYHLYASIGPRRENLMAYQRSTSDFFIPDHLREDLQRKAEATLQTFANSALPQSVEYFHSLVALDTNNQKGAQIFGYPSWIYKATSSRDGHTYALRRIEGFRLTNEAAIRTVQSWKRVSSGSLVQVHDAFTGRWFNDSSLIVVTDYHPTAQTLADKHFAIGRHAGGNRPGVNIVPENDLWAYIVQIANALKAIHDGGLAAQTVQASKILVTSKHRLRLSGCGVLDIVTYEQRKPVQELQRRDIEDLGRLVLGIAARNQTAYHNVQKALDLVSRSYTDRLRACLAWLLTPPPETTPDGVPHPDLPTYDINMLLNNIADKVVSAFDSALHYDDELSTNLMSELENGRLVRLLTKINVILERPESSHASGATPQSSTNPNMLNQPSSAWSETGERYYLKLFRDYVFHQVDHEGRPVLDLGHIISCLNKLDAGVEEKLQLVSRDEQNVFIVTYREIKRGFEAAWAEISKASNAARR